MEQQISHSRMESHSQLEESCVPAVSAALGGRDFSETVAQKHSTLLSRWSRPACASWCSARRYHPFCGDASAKQWSINRFAAEFAAMCGAGRLRRGGGTRKRQDRGGRCFRAGRDCACILDAIREAPCRSCIVASCGISRSMRPEICPMPSGGDANCRTASSRQFPYANLCRIRNQRTRLSYTGADDILQAVKACSYPDISRGVGRFFADITRAATLPSYKLAYFDMLSRLNKLIPECAENKQTMLVNMLDLLYENCYESTEVLQQDLYKFCILLADTLYEQRSAQLSGGLLGTIYDYVEENYASPALSLSSIAESLRFSPSYLTRYFKEKTGISLMQYIDRKRFEESKRLLAATALPVKAIVERVGYTDEANFSRKFKKYEGVTPTQYRAMQK
ncbi:MAG: helix-turn-helix domain-containing protein, partial [Ruthenibacterium lactatiformans]